MANQKGPMEPAEHVGRHDGRVVVLFNRHCGAIDETVAVTWCCLGVAAVLSLLVAALAVGQRVAAEKGIREICGFAIWWQQVMCNIFDKNTLALCLVSIGILLNETTAKVVIGKKPIVKWQSSQINEMTLHQSPQF